MTNEHPEEWFKLFIGITYIFKVSISKYIELYLYKNTMRHIFSSLNRCQFFHPPIHPFSLTNPSAYSFIHPSIYLLTRPSIYIPFNPTIHLPSHLSIHLFIRPSIHLSAHLSIHQSPSDLVSEIQLILLNAGSFASDGYYWKSILCTLS